MFEVPRAKSVRRSELDSPASSQSTSPDQDTTAAAEAKLAAYFGGTFGDDTTSQADKHHTRETVGQVPADAKTTAEEDEEGAYAFRLFAKPSSAAKADGAEPAKIVIRSPSPLNKEPGLVVSRSKEHYLAKPWTSEHQAQASAITCTQESIFAEAAKRWIGCEIPWRVKTIKMTKKQARGLEVDGAPAEGVVDGEEPASKARSGKKRRILLRKRAKAKVERAEKAKVVAAEKEAEEREKRTKRNREKKVKKKQREKAKKEAGAAQGGEGDGDAGDEVGEQGD